MQWAMAEQRMDDSLHGAKSGFGPVLAWRPNSRCCAPIHRRKEVISTAALSLARGSVRNPMPRRPAYPGARQIRGYGFIHRIELVFPCRLGTAAFKTMERCNRRLQNTME